MDGGALITWLVVGGLVYVGWNEYRKDRKEKDADAAMERSAYCSRCGDVRLNSFNCQSFFGLQLMHREGGWYCPRCDRLYDYDAGQQRFVDVTSEWVEGFTHITYCSRCTGFVEVASEQPPVCRCRSCDATFPVNLREVHQAARERA